MDSGGVIPIDDVAQELAARLADGPPERFELKAPKSLYVSDVEADADRFRQQAAYYSEMDLPFPCVRAETAELVPVDALPSMGFVDLVRPFPNRHFGEAVIDTLRNEAEETFSESGFQYEETHPEEARSAFRSGLAAFLSARLEAHPPPLLARIVKGLRAGGGDDPVVPPGTATWTFEAITRASNLRVHYSPSYWIKESAYVFAGSVTTPARGHMPAGTYYFGTMGHGSRRIRWDSNSRTRIPPAHQVQLVNA